LWTCAIAATAYSLSFIHTLVLQGNPYRPPEPLPSTKQILDEKIKEKENRRKKKYEREREREAEEKYGSTTRLLFHSEAS